MAIRYYLVDPAITTETVANYPAEGDTSYVFSEIASADFAAMTFILADPTVNKAVINVFSPEDPEAYKNVNYLSTAAGITLNVYGKDFTSGETAETIVSFNGFGNMGPTVFDNATLLTPSVENAASLTFQNGAILAATMTDAGVTTASTVSNTGTINVATTAIVDGVFSGSGTINLTGTPLNGLSIKRDIEADVWNTVNFAAGATTLLTDSTIEGGEVNVNRIIKLQSGNALAAETLNLVQYIYVEGENNTINAPISTEGKFVVLRNGGELVDSTVLGAKVKMDDGDYYKTAAQKAAISGTGEYTSIIVRTSSQASADVVNELTIQDTGDITGDFVFVRKDLYVGLNNQTGKLVLDNAKVAVVDPDYNVNAVFTVRGPTGVGSTAELTNGSLLTAEQAIIYYGCTVNVELGSTFLADSIGIAAGTTAGGTINIVVDSDDLVKTERYTLVDADSINATIALKVSLDEDDAVAIVDGAKLVTVDDVDYFITTLDHTGVYITSDSQATLYVNSDWSTLDNGEFIDGDGYLVGYNAFGSFVDALTMAQGLSAEAYPDGVTISVTSSEETAQSLLFYNGGTPTVFNTDVTIEAAGELATVVIPFTEEGIFLTAGNGTTFTVDDSVTIQTTTTGTGISDGAIYLNFHDLTTGEFVIAGNLISATEIKIYGETEITGSATAGTLLWINAHDHTVTVNGGELDAENIMVSSGSLVTIDEADVEAKGLALGGADIFSVDTVWDLSTIGTETGSGNATYTFLDSEINVFGSAPGDNLNTVGDINAGELRLGKGKILNLIASDLTVAAGEEAYAGTGAIINAGTINLGVGFAAVDDDLMASGSSITAVSLSNSGTINVTASSDELPADASIQSIFDDVSISLVGTENSELLNSGTINLAGANDGEDDFSASLETNGYINNRQTGKIKVTDGASIIVNGKDPGNPGGRSIINFASTTSKGTITIGSAAVPAVGEVGDDDYAAPVAATKGSLTAAYGVANNGAVIETYGGSELEIGTTLQNYNNGTVSINDSYLHASKVTNAEGCTFTVAGESTLALGILEGTIQLLDGATLTATVTTGGTFEIENAADTVTFVGTNAFATTAIANAGTITVDAGASISAKSIAGGTLNLVANTTAIGAETATIVVTADLSSSSDTAIQVNGEDAFATAAELEAFYAADKAFVAVATDDGDFTVLKNGNQYSLIQTPSQATLYVGYADNLTADNMIIGYNAFTSFKEALLKAVEVGSATVSVVSENYEEEYAGDFAPNFKSALTITGESVSLTNDGELILGTNPASDIVINNSIATTATIVVSWQAWVEEGPRPKTNTTINADISAGSMIQFGSDATVAQTATINGGNVQFSGPYASDLSYDVSITGKGNYEATDDPQVQAGTLTFVDGNVTVTDSKVNSTTGKILFTDDGVSRERALSANLVSTRTTWNVNELKVAYYAGSDTAEATRAVTLAEGAGVFTFTNSVLNITGALDNVARKRIGEGSVISDAAIAGAPALTITLNASDMTAATINNAGTIEANAGSLVKATSTATDFVLKNAKGGTINAYGSTIQSANGLQNWGTMLVSGTNASLSVGGSLYNGNNNAEQGLDAVLTVENGASLTGAVFNYRRMNLTKAQVGPATGTGRVFNNNGTLNAVNTNFNVGALNNKNWFNFNQDSTATYTAKNTINATAIDNTVSFKAAYADITTGAITNSGTFEVANSSVTGGSVSTTGTFNVSGDATLNFALSGQVTVKDNAVFTKSNITDTESTGDAAGKLFIAADKTATFKDVTDGETTVGNTVSVDIVNDGGIINVGIAADAENNIAAAAGTLNAGNISYGTIKIAQASKLISTGTIDQATITVDGQLTAAKFTASTITITAAGKVAEADPIALTVTGDDGIANSVIDITVDTTTPLTENSYQYVAGKIGAGVTFKVNGNTVVDNTDIADTGYIFTSKGGTGAWIVKKGDTKVLKVGAYTPATDGWNISKFASLVLALKGVQSDTVSLVVEDEYAPATPETLTDDLIVTFANNAAISGKAFTLAGDEDANKENLILRAADGKTLTIGNNITLNNANIVLNYGKQSTAIVSGNLKGNEVQIDGNATVTGTLTADTLLWLRNGKSVATPGAEGNAITLSKAVSAETVLISSGKVAMTTADADVSGTSLIIGPVDDTTAAVSIVSDGADWTFTSNMLATGTNADSFTLNGGSITFAGTAASSIKITNPVVHNDDTNPVPASTALIENANFTLTLNSGAKLNANTIDNIGKIIMVDGSATEINATAIVNRASAEVPIPAQKAIINAKNITAGSIENYGTIGNLEVENQKIAKLDVGTLTNNKYGGVFATALEADSIENSGEIVVTTLTITSANGLIDNKVGGKIAHDTVAMTIDAKAINNDGYISTHGGAITATAITNGAYNAETKDGLIVTDSIEAGSITNNGRIEVGSIVTGGAWSSNSGELTVKNGSLTAKIDNYGTLSVIASSITSASIDVHSGSFTVSGASTLTNVTVYEGALDLADATLAGATIVGGVLGDTVGFVRIAEGKSATFNGTNSLTNGADLVNNGTLTINAAAENCLVVNGDFTNAGAITINVDAEALPIAVGEYKQIISVTGDVVNSGSFNAGSYQVIIQNDSTEAGANGVYVYNAGGSFDKSTIVVDGTLGSDIKIGDPVNFGGDEYVFGITAFKTADEIANLTAETTALKFKSSSTSYGNLNLARTGVTAETAPVTVTVTKTDGTGTGTQAIFTSTDITTDANFNVLNVTLGALTIEDATVNFVSTTETVTADAASITDSVVDFSGAATFDSIEIEDSFVNFNGVTSITGDLVVTDTDTTAPRQKARVNFGETTAATSTTIGGNVTITNADVDFDDETEITGNLEVNGDGEVEFDLDSTVTGTVTLAAGSKLEADNGYTFQANGGVINGTVIVTKDDVDPDAEASTAILGSISGTGTIYTDVDSVLTFSGTYGGLLSIDVTGLERNAGKSFSTKSSGTFTIAVTGENVAEGTSYSKYFQYGKTTGLTQRVGACNVITANGDADILEAVNHSWTVTYGGNTTTYYADNVNVTGGATATLYLQGNSPDQHITITGDYVEGVYGGTYQDENTGRNPKDLGGNINITVESGTFKKVLVGGDRINVASGKSAYYYREADINLTINGGTFNNYVAAGMIYQGENLSGYAEINNTNLTITAGTFAANKGVFGGNFASKKTGSVRTTVTGTSSVKIVAGEGDIILNSALYVGSYGAGAVGATNLTFTGIKKDGEKLQFKQIWGGSSSDKIVKGETELGNGTYEGTVARKRTLSFTGFTGAIDCDSITGFSDVIVDDSTATLGKVNLSNVSNWEFDVDSKIIGNSFTNDFKGDTFVFGTADDVANLASNFSWNVFEGIGDLKGTFGATNSFKSVTLFGETATWNDASAFASTNYTLSLQTIGEGESATTNMVVAKKLS